MQINTLATSQPTYLCNLISVQPSRNTRSLSAITLARAHSLSKSQIAVFTMHCEAHGLWHQLPDSAFSILLDSSSSMSSYSLSITLSFQPENLPFPQVFFTLIISPFPPGYLYGFWHMIQLLDLIMCSRLRWLIAYLILTIYTDKYGQFVRSN